MVKGVQRRATRENQRGRKGTREVRDLFRETSLQRETPSSHFSSCCSFLPLMDDEHNAVWSSLPCFHTGQRMQSMNHPPYWIDFPSTNFDDETLLGDCVWRCPTSVDDVDRENEKAGKHYDVMGEGNVKPAVSHFSSCISPHQTSGSCLRSCGAQLLKSRVDLRGAPSQLIEDIKSRRWAIIGWSASGSKLAVWVYESKTASDSGPIFEHSDILLLSRKCGALPFFQWIEVEKEDTFMYVHDMKFTSYTDRCMLALIKIGKQHVLHAYRLEKGRGQRQSQYQRVQRVELDTRQTRERPFCFFSPSLSCTCIGYEEPIRSQF